MRSSQAQGDYKSLYSIRGESSDADGCLCNRKKRRVDVWGFVQGKTGSSRSKKCSESRKVEKMFSRKALTACRGVNDVVRQLRCFLFWCLCLYLILVNQTDLFFVTDPLCSRWWWRRRRRKDEQCWITITFVRIIIIRSLLIACLTCSIIVRFSSPSFFTRLHEWKAHCYCLFCQLHLSFSLLMYICISLSLCFRLR